MNVRRSSRTRWRRASRSALGAAAFVAVVACSQDRDPGPDPGPPPVPVAVDSVHVMLTFSPDGSGVNRYRDTSSGPLALQVAKNGDVTGSLAIVPTTDQGIIARVAPTTKTVDLTPYRGERLFLVAETKTYHGFILAPVALALDDLRIQ